MLVLEGGRRAGDAPERQSGADQAHGRGRLDVSQPAQRVLRHAAGAHR